MEQEIRVPARTARLWQVRAGLITAAPVAVLLRLSAFTLWLLLPAGILLAAGAVLIFFFLPRHFASYAVSADSRAVIVRRGFFIRAEYILPLPRMIYATSFSSPAARRLGLCGLTLRAARGMLILPELAREDAERILAVVSGGGEA